MKVEVDPPPINDERLMVGLMIQPFLAGAVAYLAFPILLLDGAGHTMAGGYPTDLNDAARSVAVGVAFVALLITLFVALPAVLYLTKRGRVSLAKALLFGFACGNVPTVVAAVGAGAFGVSGALRSFAFASLLGLAGAATFWVIALRERSSNSGS